MRDAEISSLNLRCTTEFPDIWSAKLTQSKSLLSDRIPRRSARGLVRPDEMRDAPFDSPAPRVHGRSEVHALLQPVARTIYGRSDHPCRRGIESSMLTWHLLDVRKAKARLYRCYILWYVVHGKIYGMSKGRHHQESYALVRRGM